MSNKMTCPGCASHTSDVLYAVERDEPCPYCGLSAHTIVEVDAMRRRREDDALTERAMAAEIRADRAESDLRAALAVLDRIRRALKDEA